MFCVLLNTAPSSCEILSKFSLVASYRSSTCLSNSSITATPASWAFARSWIWFLFLSACSAMAFCISTTSLMSFSCLRLSSWTSAWLPSVATSRFLIFSVFLVISALFLATALAKACSCEPLTASVEVALIWPAPTLTIWRSLPWLPTDTVPILALALACDAPANPVRFKLSTTALLTTVASLPAVLLPSSTEPLFASFVLEPRIKTSCLPLSMVLLEPMATEFVPVMVFLLPRATAFSALALFSTPAANEFLPVARLS